MDALGHERTSERHSIAAVLPIEWFQLDVYQVVHDHRGLCERVVRKGIQVLIRRIPSPPPRGALQLCILLDFMTINLALSEEDLDQ